MIRSSVLAFFRKQVSHSRWKAGVARAFDIYTHSSMFHHSIDAATSAAKSNCAVFLECLPDGSFKLCYVPGACSTPEDTHSWGKLFLVPMIEPGEDSYEPAFERMLFQFYEWHDFYPH